MTRYINIKVKYILQNKKNSTHVFFTTQVTSFSSTDMFHYREKTVLVFLLLKKKIQENVLLFFLMGVMDSQIFDNSCISPI